MRRKLGFDLDGTLYPWTEVVFDEFIRLGKIPPQTNYYEFWEKDWEQYEPSCLFRNLVADPTTYDRFPMSSEIRKLLHELRVRYELFFITHRPDSAELTTRRWLREASLYNDNLYITKNKFDVIRNLGLDYYVEDRTEYIRELEKFVTTFVVPTPWNKNDKFKRAIRLNNIYELRGYLL